MFGILGSVNVGRNGGIYQDYESLERDLNGRMEREGYKVVKARSHRKAAGGDFPGNEITRCDLVCNRGGRPYKSSATKHKTTTKKTGCPWRAKAVYRKTMGGWVLTIGCDQHNHDPGTPEPPTPEPRAEDMDVDDDDENDTGGPQVDADTSAAIQVAGVSEPMLRLTGDTFQQFKNEYRKLTGPERHGALAQLQLRIAALYALQNEDVQRQKRVEAQDRRHREIEEGIRRGRVERSETGRRRRREPAQNGSQTSTPQQPLPQAGQQCHRRSQMQPSPFDIPRSVDLIFPVPGIDGPGFPESVDRDESEAQS